jgi:hypothetical protein
METKNYPIAIPCAQLPDGRLFPCPSEAILVHSESVNYFFLAIPFFNGDGLIGIVPTPEMIKDICHIIGKDSIQKFCDWHNDAHLLQSTLIAEGRLEAIGVFPSAIEICRRLNFCTDAYYYHKALCTYCQAIFWKGDISIKKQTSRLDRYAGALNKAIIVREKPSESFETTVQTKWLKRITDYVDAKRRLENYDLLLRTEILKNPEIKDLVHKRNKEHREFLERVQKGKKSSSESFNLISICPICGEWIDDVTRFPSSCGSEKCKKEYEPVKRAKGRETVSRELFKHLITKTGKGIRCQSCRKRKRVLYTDKFFCFECCLEHKNF